MLLSHRYCHVIAFVSLALLNWKKKSVLWTVTIIYNYASNRFTATSINQPYDHNFFHKYTVKNFKKVIDCDSSRCITILIIQNGSECSLQSAFNTLEIFGTLSGLKINEEKTKIVWICKKRNSKIKLSIPQNLDWDTSEFTLLGIVFSTNLDLIPEINYLKAITKIKSFLKQWQYRNLTPIGKISLIKSTILSKFVPLFTSIPTKKLYLDQINEIVYNFLWDQKQDKIKQKVICANYMQGGLKMINIYNFVKGLKISWINRLINNMNDNSEWSELFNGFYGKSDKLTTLGGEWGEWFFKKRQITNEFWLEVFNSWKQLCRVQEPKSNIEINSSCLWYNYQFSDNPLYFDKCQDKELDKLGIFLMPVGQ